MGLFFDSVQQLFFAQKQGVSYEKVAMLGRQNLFATPAQMEQLALNLGVSLPVESIFSEIDPNGAMYAEKLFEAMGANIVHSFDFGAYENPTFIHDMNNPLPAMWKNTYSLVLDGGTFEHVFNYPVALKNAMEMVEPGGHLLLMTPSNNHFGHGFYQFSPDLYFSLLIKENGYKLKYVMATRIYEDYWYTIADPQVILQRVEIPFTGVYPCSLFVLAERVGDVPDSLTIQQSDYKILWSGKKLAENPYRFDYNNPFDNPLFFTPIDKNNVSSW